WIDSNREKLRSRAAILQAKADWEQNGRRDDMLLPTGLQLERARSLLADPGDITTDDIKEFISLSSVREQHELKEREAALARDEARVAEIRFAKRRTRNARWAFALVLLGWLAAGIFSLFMMKQGEDRLKHAQANGIAEVAWTKLLRGEMDSALRLAAHSIRIDLGTFHPHPPDDLAKRLSTAVVLMTAVSQARWRRSLGGHDRSLYSAAFSPDGSRIVTASADNTARIWDTASAKEIAVLRGHDSGVRSAAFSPDGSRIVTASRDKTVRIWHTVSAREIAVLRGHDGSVNSAAFSRDGSRIITASADNTARISDARSAKQLALL